jgi:hypothetical protein
MSDAHVGAKLRVSERDLERLRCRARGEGTAAGPVVALFSTGRASEAVSLDVGETVFAQLPLAEAGAAEAAEAAGASGAPGALGEAAGASGAPGAPGAPAEALRWRKLVVVAHSAYTGGMRVSGIMHRALVWLEWE